MEAAQSSKKVATLYMSTWDYTFSVYPHLLISILLQEILIYEASNTLCFIYTDHPAKQYSGPCSSHEGISGV